MIPVNNGSLSLWNTIVNVLQASEHQWSNKTLYFFILCPLLHIGDFNRHHSRSHSRKTWQKPFSKLGLKTKSIFSLWYKGRNRIPFNICLKPRRACSFGLSILWNVSMEIHGTRKKLMMRLAKPYFPGLNQISINPTGRYFQLKRRTILEGPECSIQGVL